MKIGIIGSGNVGAAAANAMVLRGIGREIVLVDLNTKRVRLVASAEVVRAAINNLS